MAITLKKNISATWIIVHVLYVVYLVIIIFFLMIFSVGEPIEVPKVENPSQELINEYHEKFFSALLDLFEKYREKYDMNGKDSELVFL